MDVKTAFLNGNSEEEIYMEQLEGYMVPEQKNKVCKLVKALYVLKQAPKQWHEKFDSMMISNGFMINNVDKCIHHKGVNDNVIIICLYVDDLFIFGKRINIVHATKRFLASKFDMKDMSEANASMLSLPLIKWLKRLAMTSIQQYYPSGDGR
ncbi:hypothetical protein RJ639_028325 [Escallonia herrerae]|uniref:Reverse transcriptase Ty1/copia-type domain-containing protein n=1 Tax=Escallonia herrerae TaxID=1293975 RepID=A0AA88X2J8_9ASTE|nr:hypothetical protein RJ639_028325 [Escallonia herrerae]